MAGPAIVSGDNREIAVGLWNVTDEPQRGRLDGDLPAGWEEPELRHYDLKPGEQLDWTPTVRVAGRVAPSYDLALWVHRTHDSSPSLGDRDRPFEMVPATHWRIEVPDGTEISVSFPGNHHRILEGLDANAVETYVARSTRPQPARPTIRAGTTS